MLRIRSLIIAALGATAIAFPTFAGTHGASAETFQDRAASAASVQFTSSDSNAAVQTATSSATAAGTANGDQPSFCLGPDLARLLRNGLVTSHKQTSATGKQSDWLKKLKKDVSDTGIPAKEYVTDTYDCDDFAGDLEIKLTALGYDATFTVYWCLEADKSYSAHALTDVHAGDGTVTWIEPQTGEVADLDFDGDGSVEVSRTHGDYRKATDGDCRIEFYDSRAAAEKAGVIMD